jgi:hypothetical protein
MRILAALALILLPSFGTAQNITFDDGPWIAIPAGMTFPAQKSPAEEIHAMANLDGNPSVVTDEEREMIALLSQIFGTAPTK